MAVEVCKEMCRSLLLACQRSVAAKRAATVSAVLIAASVGWILGLAGCEGRADRFQVLDVQGSVAYVDGGVVPVDMMLVKFIPEAGRGGVSNTSMPVTARVDASTGRFQAKWASRKEEEKSVPVMWRVVILSGDQQAFDEKIVPREYGDVEKTPLVVAMHDSPLLIRLRRPSSRKP